MKSKKVEIEGLNVEIIKFNTFKGGILLGKTTKIFAPAIKDIVNAFQSDLDEAGQVGVLAGVIQDLFNTNTPEEIMEYIKEIVAGQYVIINGKKILDLNDIDALIEEDQDGLYITIMIVAESIKYNFAKFLGKLMPNLDG